MLMFIMLLIKIKTTILLTDFITITTRSNKHSTIIYTYYILIIKRIFNIKFKLI